MAISFNIPSAPHSSYLTTIDNEVYKFVFRWSSRASVWHLDVFTSEGVSLVVGAKLVPNVGLIRSSHINAPEGKLGVVNNTADKHVPNRDNIGVGQDFELVYLTREEIENAN